VKIEALRALVRGPQNHRSWCHLYQPYGERCTCGFSDIQTRAVAEFSALEKLLEVRVPAAAQEVPGVIDTATAWETRVAVERCLAIATNARAVESGFESLARLSKDVQRTSDFKEGVAVAKVIEDQIRAVLNELPVALAHEVVARQFHVTDVRNCARCGGSHDAMRFQLFVRPIGDYTHWGSCPTTGDRVYLRLIPETEPTQGG
jgi:hypothetical protein